MNKFVMSAPSTSANVHSLFTSYWRKSPLGVSAAALLCLSAAVMPSVVQADTNFTALATVNGQSQPWLYVNGGLNTAYQYGLGDGQTPFVVSSATASFRFLVGDTLTLTYSSGTVAASSPGYPFVNTGGETDTVMNANVDAFNGAAPSFYMNPSTYPIYLVELVGTFANSSGQIVGTPFAIGNSATLTIPAGATRLQLGVNDNKYSDNLGAWNILVTGLVVPEPTTVTLAGLGLAILFSTRLVRRK